MSSIEASCFSDRT